MLLKKKAFPANKLELRFLGNSFYLIMYLIFLFAAPLTPERAPRPPPLPPGAAEAARAGGGLNKAGGDGENIFLKKNPNNLC